MADYKVGENVSVTTSAEVSQVVNKAVVTIHINAPDGKLTLKVEIAPYYNQDHGGPAIQISSSKPVPQPSDSSD